MQNVSSSTTDFEVDRMSLFIRLHVWLSVVFKGWFLRHVAMCWTDWQSSHKYWKTIKLPSVLSWSTMFSKACCWMPSISAHVNKSVLLWLHNWHFCATLTTLRYDGPTSVLCRSVDLCCAIRTDVSIYVFAIMGCASGAACLSHRVGTRVRHRPQFRQGQLSSSSFVHALLCLLVVDLHCITIRLSSSVGYSFKLAILRCAVGIGQHDGDRTVRVCAPTARCANVDA